MSRGEIVNHLGEGQYQVRLKYAVERLKQELQRAEARLLEIDTILPQRQLEQVNLENDSDTIEHQINLLIPDYVSDRETYSEQMKSLQSELIRLQADIRQLRFEISELKIERLGLIKRVQVINSVPEQKSLTAWCADFTEDLAGDVGLIDLNDEGGQGLLLQPGYEGNASYSPSRDGQLMPRAAQSDAQVYFNAAILPGVQKWRPRYRIGTIANIENDTCTLTLAQASSSAQGLNINERNTYDQVPIQYMNCNDAVFEDGDQVVARFTQHGPLVVGFADGPRRCELPVFIVVNLNRIYEMEPDFSAVKRSFGFFASDIGHIAVCEDQVAYVREYTMDEIDRSSLRFLGGPTYVTDEDRYRFTGVHGDKDGIWAAYIDNGATQAGVLYGRRYNLSGLFEREVVMSDSDFAAESAFRDSFTSDGEILTDYRVGAISGSLVTDGYNFSVDANTGARVGLYPMFSRQALGTCINSQFMFIGSSNIDFGAKVDIFERGTYNQVGTVTLPRGSAGGYQNLAASNTKFYAFAVVPPEGGDPSYECYVEIYNIVGSTLEYQKTVDLKDKFGFDSVYSSAVDTALLLE